MKRYPSLAAYLEGTGKTQQQLASELGITQAQISSYLNGRSLPRPDLAVRISELTGVSIEAMVRARAKHERSEVA